MHVLCSVQQCHDESLLLERKFCKHAAQLLHCTCGMCNACKVGSPLDEPETLACLARQLYLGHSSAGTESAGPPTAKTIALTRHCPRFRPTAPGPPSAAAAWAPPAWPPRPRRPLLL